MTRIRCYLLEPTDRVRVKARRYTHDTAPDCCSAHPGKYSYHDASAVIEEEPIERDERGYVNNGLKPVLPHDDSRWPVQCACGYQFQEADEWQRFVEEVYRRADTGEELTIRDAPAGAMWYAPWLLSFVRPQLPGGPLIVKLPDGTDWEVDSRANNCTLPDDNEHHCWVIEGTPPDLSVSKQGKTCSAGAGSIQSPRYHGFLRNGYLED